MVNKFRNIILKCKNYYTALLSTELPPLTTHFSVGLMALCQVFYLLPLPILMPSYDSYICR